MTINNKVEEAQKMYVHVFIINYPYYNNMLEHESKKKHSLIFFLTNTAPETSHYI